MKKHLLLLLLILIIVTGCESVSNLELNETLNVLTFEENRSNIYRVGYKYYLPVGMQNDDNLIYNEVITNNKYNFYLYVDVISYMNKTENLYNENEESYYSEKFEYDSKFGYLEINLSENDKYLIEIMYNYAKIEVMVDESDINESIIYASNVLKSIKYSDKVIENILGDNVLNFTEEEYNIFNTTTNDSSYLNYDYDYVEPEDIIYDQDQIN